MKKSFKISETENMDATQTVDMSRAAAWEKMTGRDMVWVTGFSVLLGMAMLFQTGRMTMFLIAVALISLIGKRPGGLLSGRICVPVVGLLLFGIMQGAAAIYSPFDTDAVAEFYKWMAVFALSVILLARYERKHIHGLLWGISAISTLSALISVDGGGSGVLFSVYDRISQMMGYDLNLEEIGGTSASGRIVGIYGDANITACIFGVAVLLGLYLLGRSETRRHKLCASLSIGINAVAFFMSLSRGAMGFFALALMVWFATAKKGTRVELFLTCVVAGVSTFACAGVALLYGDKLGALPCLMAILCGILIFALDEVLLRKLVVVVNQHFKLAVGTTAAVVVLCVGYLIAALTVTGPMEFAGQTRLIREIDLEPGTYTVQAQGTGLEQCGGFVVEERVTGAWIFLARGDARSMTFTVPENMEGNLLIGVEGREGVVLEKLVLSNGTELPLRHYLLPLQLEERLFNATSKNLEQRIQFYKDAWKIFAQSPIIGQGLASSEGLGRAVQPYYYESKYVHNHILQVMCDTGLAGLLGFGAVLLGSGWLILKGIRREKDGLSAMLLAVWILINGHSLMEINFSVRGFACMSFVLLLLPVLAYQEIKQGTVGEEKTVSKRLVNGGLPVAAALYLVIFGGLLLSHRWVLREAAQFRPNTETEFMETTKSFIQRDVFEQEQRKLDFVAYSYIWDMKNYQSQAEKYVEDLLEGGTYSACSGLCKYYYLPQSRWTELFEVSRKGIAQVASSDDGWNLQMNFYREFVLPAIGEENITEFFSGVDGLENYMNTYNEGRMEPVSLNEKNQEFLLKVEAAKQLPPEQAWAWLMVETVIKDGT